MLESRQPVRYRRTRLLHRQSSRCPKGGRGGIMSSAACYAAAIAELPSLLPPHPPLPRFSLRVFSVKATGPSGQGLALNTAMRHARAPLIGTPPNPRHPPPPTLKPPSHPAPAPPSAHRGASPAPQAPCGARQPPLRVADGLLPGSCRQARWSRTICARRARLPRWRRSSRRTPTWTPSPARCAAGGQAMPGRLDGARRRMPCPAA